MTTLISLTSPFEHLTPVSLDTSNFISLGREVAPEWYPVFLQMKECQYTFCLSDVSIAELLNPVHDPGFDLESFYRSVIRLRKIIDSAVPVLPGGIDMEALCGMNIPAESSQLSITQILENSRKIWRRFDALSARNGLIDVSEALELKKDMKEIKERYRKTFSSPVNTAMELNLDLATLANDSQAKKRLHDGFRSKFACYPAKQVDCAKVLDLYIELRVDLFIESTRKRGYNPHKAKDNHPLDLLAFEALPLPALLLVDNNMYNRVQNARSYQKAWVYTANRLAAAFLNGDLKNLKLHFQ